MVPDIIELPEREGNPNYIMDPDLAYLLQILSYLSCTVYEIENE